MSSQEFLPLPAIVAQVRTLCREKRTGTLLIKNNSQLLGQISFRDGEIVSLFSQGKHGVDALPSLPNIESGTIAFFESKVSVNTSLPSTSDILEYLSHATPPPRERITVNRDRMQAVPCRTTPRTFWSRPSKAFSAPSPASFAPITFTSSLPWTPPSRPRRRDSKPDGGGPILRTGPQAVGLIVRLSPA